MDAPPVLALLPWGSTIEDFLRPNNLTLADFCGDFTGSWIFGYAQALRTAGVETVLVCVSGEVDTVTRVEHGATGTPISILPVSRGYRALRSRMRYPYARTTRGTFRMTGWRKAAFPALFFAKEAAPYLATPPRLLARELEFRSCSAVLCQEYEFPRFDVCVATRRMHGLPVFAIFQGGDYRHWWVERLVRPRSIRASAGLIIPARSEEARVRSRYDPPRIASIPNPVDLGAWRPRDRAAARRSLGLDPTARVLAWHGRIEIWKKGLDTLIDAWARLTASRQGETEPWTLLLVGSGEGSASLRTRISASGLTNIHWVHRYVHEPTELSELLAAADLYVFPSRHEGFPLAPLEAMACGLPVVATDVSGIRDVLVGGATSGGSLVPLDDPAALAGEVERILGNRELCAELGANARAHAQAFGMEAVGEAVRAFVFAAEHDPKTAGVAT